MTEPHVAFLRAINVSGKNMLPMPALVAMFEAEGATNVRTYIQSGNVVFTPPPQGVAGLADRIAARIRADHGYEVPVVLRSRAELADAMRRNPYPDQAAADPTKVHVVFLAAAPAADRVGRLDPDRSPPDVFRLDGRELYVHYRDGAGRTKLTIDWIERGLGVKGTARNWRTVGKMLELAGG